MDALDFIVDRDQHMRPLEYDLSENFNELLRYMQDMGVLDNIPVGVTAESEIASISDAYPAPPRSLSVYGKSTQDGTPTPDAPVPILSVDDLSLGLAGKNLAIDSDTEYSLTTSGYARYDVDALEQDATAFTVSVDATVPTGQTLHLYGYDGKDNSNYGTFVLQSDGRYAISINTAPNLGYFKKVKQLRIYSKPYTGGTSVVTKVSKCQLEIGSTATAYEPYIGTTVTDLLPEGTSLRSLPDGTRDQLNLSYLRPSTRAGWAWYSREVTAYTGLVTLDGTESWDFGGASYNGNVGTDRYVNIASMRNAGGGLTGNDSLLSNKVLHTVNFIWSNPDVHVWKCVRFNAQIHIVFDNAIVGITSETTDRTTLIKAWLSENPITVQYPLATPTTTALDPIELPALPAPTCTVWCDGGSAQPTYSMQYVQDTNATIADLSEAIADIVSD